MGNVFVVLTPLLHGLMKLAGLTLQIIEIEPGTLMNIWVPKETVTKKDHNIMYVPPTKPAVLFLHAFAMDGIFTWFPQVLALTPKYSVYIPDLLFFGGSITDRNDRSPNFQAEFVARGLAILKVEKVTLVGLSYGGIVGFEMAKLYPELVKSMVVSATVIELTESISLDFFKKYGFTRWSDLLMPKTAEEVKILFSFGFDKFPWLPNFVYRHFLEAMYPNRTERNELLEGLVIPDKEPISNIAQEVHLLWGDYDKIFDLDHVMTMKTRLGDKTTFDVIKNAGHLVPLEQPFKYNKLLKIFLERDKKYH